MGNRLRLVQRVQYLVSVLKRHKNTGVILTMIFPFKTGRYYRPYRPNSENRNFQIIDCQSEFGSRFEMI